MLDKPGGLRSQPTDMSFEQPEQRTLEDPSGLEERVSATSWGSTLWTFLWVVLDSAIAAQIDVWATSIAYNAIFALVPLVTLTNLVFSLLPRELVHENLRHALAPYLPKPVLPLLVEHVDSLLNAPSPLLIVVTVLGFIWTVSTATSTISAALGKIGWKLEDSWLRRRARAVLLGIGLAGALAFLALSASLGTNYLLALLGESMNRDSRFAILTWLRWPLTLLAFGSASALFFRFGTMDHPRKRSVLLGGLVSGVAALLPSFLLRLYLSHARGLGGIAGSAVAVFSGLLWLYMLALGLLLGAVTAYVLEAELRGVASFRIAKLRHLPTLFPSPKRPSRG